ncbi:hypothetical protein D3C71_1566360 [compost metagenome]
MLIRRHQLISKRANPRLGGRDRDLKLGEAIVQIGHLGGQGRLARFRVSGGRRVSRARGHRRLKLQLGLLLSTFRRSE